MQASRWAQCSDVTTLVFGSITGRSPPPGQPAIQLVGKRLSVPGTERGRSAGLHACTAQFFHEVPHGEAFGNIVGGEAIAPRVDGFRAIGQDTGGQWNVLRDYQIAGDGAFGDGVVGSIEAALHLKSPDETRARGPQPLVGDQRDRYPGTFGGTEQDLLHRAGAGIGIHPYLGCRWWGVAHSWGGASGLAASRSARFFASFSSCFFFLASSRCRFSNE